MEFEINYYHTRISIFWRGRIYAANSSRRVKGIFVEGPSRKLLLWYLDKASADTDMTGYGVINHQSTITLKTVNINFYKPYPEGRPRRRFSRDMTRPKG